MIPRYLYENCFDYFVDDTYFAREESFHAHTSGIFTNVMLMLLVSVRENLFSSALVLILGRPCNCVLELLGSVWKLLGLVVWMDPWTASMAARELGFPVSPLTVCTFYSKIK